MGLIKAAIGSVGGVLADQWKEYFYCESLPNNVLVSKGAKRVSGRSSNTKGTDNIISNGSIIAVADGQCMMIVEQGKVVDLCAEPGEYKYDMSTEPSLFAGKLGDSIKGVFGTLGKRFTFGGDAAKDQRVYYFNTKEIMGMKYGTASPVPFRVVDQRAGIDIDISLRCFGQYSFRLSNPMVFYANVCGNVSDTFVIQGSELETQLKSEFLTALQPAFGKLSEMGIRYSAILNHTKELSKAMQEELSKEWEEDRGITVENVGVTTVKATEEDEQMIKELQRNAAFMDPTRAAAHMVGAQAAAMRDAANNSAGAMTGFMGLGMAQGAGGINAQNLFAMGQQQQAQQQAAAPAATGWTCSCGQGGNTGKFCQSCGSPKPAPAGSWKCSCGAEATGKFCPECGSPKPAPAGSWKCACGAEVTGNFCPECGSKKPADDGWTCSCGQVNKGKFCPNCGGKKPAGVPQYKCDKCGWEPEKGVTPPRFCPECGDPFDNGDIM
ncbi:MAG: SPFH domain-containing protein [Oscillospiraceae bacterium]|nr:SPFH domain-containing protein [Oscillospiraceae bacterium]